MNVLVKLEAVHQQGAPLLAFNTAGDILASIGLDAKNTLCVHDWAKGALLLETPTTKDRILSCSFLANFHGNLHKIHNIDNSSPIILYSGSNTAGKVGNSDELNHAKKINFTGKDVLVVGGENGYLKFWWWQGQNASSQSAIWGNHSKNFFQSDKKSSILCVKSSNNEICVTGLSNGNLLVWKNCMVSFHSPLFKLNSFSSPLFSLALLSTLHFNS
jgi:hypothetical protein